MATLKKRRERWYARVLWYENTGKQKEKQVPLRTKSKVTARERLSAVNKVESDIRSGLEFTFPWMNEDGQTKVSRYTIYDALQEWMGNRQSNGIRPSTIRRNRYSMDSFMSIIGSTRPLSSIDTKLIDKYRQSALEKGLTPGGVNINLRTIKTFLRWCQVRGYIEKNPHMDMVSVPKSMPLYIPDRIFAELMKLPWLEQHYKNAFWFYRETGCRLSEPFIGELDGNWLLINGADTKQRADKELSLSDECLRICIEMREQMKQFNGKPENWTSNLSKTFLNAIREVDGMNTKYHFHCLRHTFAVRRYLQTRDIYLVKKEMGHASVTTTEVYAQFSLRRLTMDFPNIIEKSQQSDSWKNGHEIDGHNGTFTVGRAVAS